MGNTKKVGSTGRLGSRYGVGIRRRLLKIEPIQLKKHACPSCGFRSVKRLNKGIFKCLKCNSEFVGGAYIPQTLSGSLISKVVSQKSFSGTRKFFWRVGNKKLLRYPSLITAQQIFTFQYMTYLFRRLYCRVY